MKLKSHSSWFNEYAGLCVLIDERNVYGRRRVRDNALLSNDEQ